VQQLCSVCFAGDFIYWTDWHRRTVERVHKLTGKQRSVVVDQLPGVMGLTAANMSALTGLTHNSVTCCLGMKTKATEQLFPLLTVHSALLYCLMCFYV